MLHLLFLYGKEPGASAKRFLADLRRVVARLRKQLQLSKVGTERVYALLQWCDALSLLIFEHALQPERAGEGSKACKERIRAGR
jgi:hypothetical protein